MEMLTFELNCIIAGDGTTAKRQTPIGINVLVRHSIFAMYFLKRTLEYTLYRRTHFSKLSYSVLLSHSSEMRGHL